MEKIKKFRHTVINVIVWILLTVIMFIINPQYAEWGLVNTVTSIFQVSFVFLIIYLMLGLFFDAIIFLLSKYRLMLITRILSTTFVLITILATLWLTYILFALATWR